MRNEQIKKEIIENLKPIDPAKVILFGSFANGYPTRNSDVDPYVVTKDDFIPQTYEESFDIVRKVYKALKSFRREYASDIIVHTWPMYQKFIKGGSSFSREISQNGINLI